MRLWLVVSMAFVGGIAVGAAAMSQQPAATDRVFQSPGGTKLRVLVDDKDLKGTEVEIAELTFPPNADSGDHQHGSTETFYVLEGELEHVVTDPGAPAPRQTTSLKLTPGMAGSVRPPAMVRHKTGPAGARALVIWAPGGELARVTARWRRR
jgi:mannose-6-phosphate isomerase-like protein (cupin superfamily)